MKLQEMISEWVDQHADELIQDISEVVSIRSVKDQPAPGMPFGAGIDAAISKTENIAQRLGLTTAVYDRRVLTADIGPQPAAVDILGHLDVVGEGDGWETDPYTATKKEDGCLYGRGTDDDKGPSITAMYAMKCIADLGIALKSGARLILGGDEETGGDDLPAYYRDHKPAKQTFSPDSGFPIYNTERGHYITAFKGCWQPQKLLPRVNSLHAGFRPNVVPGECSAEIAGLSSGQVLEAGGKTAEKCGVSLHAENTPGGSRITVIGKQCHAAEPWEGNNALTALLEVLSILPLVPCESTSTVKGLSELFPHGDTAGTTIGIAAEDDISGPLTMSFSILDIDSNGVCGTLDMRTPLCSTDENCRLVLERRLSFLGLTCEGGMSKVHHTPADSPFIKTLQAAYKAYTGKECECRYMGGGTYVHDIEGGVAFGGAMPGFVSNLHGANERLKIDDTVNACKIYALAIARLCGAEEESWN